MVINIEGLKQVGTFKFMSRLGTSNEGIIFLNDGKRNIPFQNFDTFIYVNMLYVATPAGRYVPANVGDVIQNDDIKEYNFCYNKIPAEIQEKRYLLWSGAGASDAYEYYAKKEVAFSRADWLYKNSCILDWKRLCGPETEVCHDKYQFEHYGHLWIKDEWTGKFLYTYRRL